MFPYVEVVAMTEFADATSGVIGRLGGKLFLPRWLEMFLCRFGCANHADLEEWRRAGDHLRAKFLEDEARLQLSAPTPLADLAQQENQCRNNQEPNQPSERIAGDLLRR